MAKIWIPKSWSGTNPPASGQRVFVGGKGAGKAVYESISAGQTKRCLQSNGRGSVFYGNVSVPNPGDPETTSDITGLNVIQKITCKTLLLKTGSSPTAGEYVAIYFDDYSNRSSGCFYGTCNLFVDPTGNETYVYAQSGSNMANLAQAHKMTFSCNGYWYTARVTVRLDSRHAYFTLNTDRKYSSNFPVFNSYQDLEKIFDGKQATLCFNKEW